MKFNFNDILEKLRGRKKEIIVVLIYVVVFSLIYFNINNLRLKEENLKFDLQMSEVKYNNIRNISFSYEELKEQYEQKEEKYNKIENYIPIDLTNKDVNNMIAEIRRDTGNLFDLGSCKVTEIMLQEKAYNCYQVKINLINGTYTQIKNFFKYIAEYESKVEISQVNLTRNLESVQGNVILLFYGTVQNGEQV